MSFEIYSSCSNFNIFSYLRENLKTRFVSFVCVLLFFLFFFYVIPFIAGYICVMWVEIRLSRLFDFNLSYLWKCCGHNVLISLYWYVLNKVFIQVSKYVNQSLFKWNQQFINYVLAIIIYLFSFEFEFVFQCCDSILQILCLLFLIFHNLIWCCVCLTKMVNICNMNRESSKQFDDDLWVLKKKANAHHILSQRMIIIIIQIFGKPLINTISNILFHISYSYTINCWT